MAQKSKTLLKRQAGKKIKSANTPKFLPKIAKKTPAKQVSGVFAKPKNIGAKPSSDPEFDVKKTKIKIIGLGGGGSNIVAGIASKIKKASFCIVNTDAQALANTAGDVSVFQFGEKFTKGLGTGMDPQLAEEAARDERERIKKLLEGNDLIILVASLGGGAGSGALPVFAQISKTLGNLTYGIFSLPFEFEGVKKDEIAQTALERTKPYLSALTILPNERVFQVVPKTTPFGKTLSYINEILSRNLEGLIETIYEPGMINIDFADVRTILSGQGKLAFLNSLEFQKSDGVDIESFENAFMSPLYTYNIEKARGLLINISGHKDLKLSEVNKILTSINERIHKDAKIILGVSESDQSGGIKVSVLATGCCANGASDLGALGRDQKPEKTPDKSSKKEKNGKKKPFAAKTLLKNKKPESQKTAVKIIQKTGSKPLAAAQKKDATAANSDGVGSPENKKKSPETFKKNDIDSDKNSEEQAVAEARRKNAIQVKKEIEREEREMLEKEKEWEVPPFLRKNKK